MPRPKTVLRITAARLAVLLWLMAGMTRGDVDRFFFAWETRSWRSAWRRVRWPKAKGGTR